MDDGAVQNALFAWHALIFATSQYRGAFACVLPPLNEMKALRRVTVPAYPEFKQEWIDFAVCNPGIDFRFPSPAQGVTPKQSVHLFDVYRSVDVLWEKKAERRTI